MNTFFESGSAKLSEAGIDLLNLLASQLKALPNRLLIEGHTDSQPYSSDTGYTNWELSSDRANSARRLLQQGGIGPRQISQVRGYADQSLRVPASPLDPSNRRISLIVQWTSDANPALQSGQASHVPSSPPATPASLAQIPTPDTTSAIAPIPSPTSRQSQSVPPPGLGRGTASASSFLSHIRSLIPDRHRQ